jgi:hypothetical protein
MLSTLSAAARSLGIDRRTVQRYVRRFPGIMEGKKVEVIHLQSLIDLFKASEGRGFPLGRIRGKRLPLTGLPKKPPAVIRRTFSQRLEIIAREINHMTDEEQQALLPMKFLSLFRFGNIMKAAKREDARERGRAEAPGESVPQQAPDPPA